MSQPITLTFQFSDGTSHDAPTVAGLDATPTYTIEVSNNNVDFFPYDTPVVDALIGQAFDDTHLDWLYIRINYDAQTNTTGIVEFPLILK